MDRIALRFIDRLSFMASLRCLHLDVFTSRAFEGNQLAVFPEPGNLPAQQMQIIATDAGLRSLTNRRVFAAGDAADPAGLGPRYFTHVGSLHAAVLVRRMLFRLPARIDYRALPRVTYTDPELAQVGMTEGEARDAGHAPEVVRWPFAENDRAVAEGRTAGLAKLVVGRRGALLGAGILGPHAGEMLGACALAVTGGASLRALAGMVAPYPTRSEAVKRAAGQLYAPKLFSGTSRRVAQLFVRLP